MKKILIAGASGFIGKRISRYFLLKKQYVIGLGTSLIHSFSEEFSNFEWVSADTTIEGDWQNKVGSADIIINLTGKSIFSYWTKRYKQNIYDSRILTTRNIVAAIKKGTTKKLISTSAVGIYGDCGNHLLSEDSLPGTDFLAQVCKDWENEALKAKNKDVSVSIMRLGVVLGDGGAMSKMVPAFKSFVGGPLGSGNQWFPWIHVKDIEKAVDFIIQNDDLDGLFNFVGPEPVRQNQFAKELGKVLNRPAFMPAPAFMVRMIMGELGKSLLQGQKVVPGHLTRAGYPFSFGEVDTALKDILGK